MFSTVFFSQIKHIQMDAMLSVIPIEKNDDRKNTLSLDNRRLLDMLSSDNNIIEIIRLRFLQMLVVCNSIVHFLLNSIQFRLYLCFVCVCSNQICNSKTTAKAAYEYINNHFIRSIQSQKFKFKYNSTNEYTYAYAHT